MSELVDHDAAAGITPPASPGGRPDFLSDVIVELGFASRETVEQAVREARAGTTVSRVLVESGAVTEDQLARATAERYGLDHVDLEAFTVEAAAANLIKPAAARRYMAVPVGFEPDGALIVAVSDPADVLGLNDIAVMTKLDVIAAVAARNAIEELVERLPLTPGGSGGAPVRRRVSAAPPPQPAEEVPAPPQAVFWQAGDVSDAGTTNPRAPSHVQVAGAPVREHQAVPAPPSPAAYAGRVPPPHAPGEPPEPAGPPMAPPVHHAAVQAPPAAPDPDPMYEELQAERAAREEQERRALTAERRLTEVTRSSGEGDRRLGDAQATAEEARKRARELVDADRRAEHARVALAELRAETDRQREQHAQIERELRIRVTTEERRRRELEERLSEVEESVFAAERAFDELGLAQRRMRGALRALVEPGRVEDDDR